MRKKNKKKPSEYGPIDLKLSKSPAVVKYPEFIKDRFAGEEVHVVGSGPSLVGFDYSRLKGKRVIAINNAYKLVEHDFCLFTDRGFARRESPEVVEETTCVSIFDADFPGHIVYRYADGDGGRANQFQLDPAKGLWHRSSSGSLGLCAALQGGANKVYIYGFDCRFFTFMETQAAAKLNGISATGLVELENRVALQRERIHPKTKNMDFQHFAHSTSSLDGFHHEREDSSSEQAFKDSIKWFARFPRDKVLNMSRFSAIPYFDKSARPYVD